MSMSGAAADPSASMGNTLADKIDRMEKMPILEQRQFDEGLVNYMVKNQYTWQKVKFIRKTYCILGVWLLTSFLISIPFIHEEEPTVNWMAGHSWMLWLCAVVLFVQISFYLTVVAFLSTGQHMMLLIYLKLVGGIGGFVWALLYVLCFTVMIDTALAAYGLATISSVFLYTLFAVLGLVVYTFALTNPDFKQMYSYMVPVGTAVFTKIVQAIFCGAATNSLEHGVALLLSVLLGWIIVYDTQLIFGSKTENGRKYPYQATMYGMAAYEMYFDLFVHFYLGALNLFPGQNNDPLSVQ